MSKDGYINVELNIEGVRLITMVLSKHVINGQVEILMSKQTY